VAKSKAIVELELKYKHKGARLEFWATVARVAVPSAAAVAITYFVTGSVDRLAGKFTYADIGIKFISDFKVTIAYTLTSAATAWALLERKLKGDTIKRLSARVTELEKRLDPGRSSSRLTERGTTRPEDH
jgi:hypothetical protein